MVKQLNKQLSKQLKKSRLKAFERSAFVAIVLALFGCATGHCRGNQHADEKHLTVYKQDGSKQCSSIKGTSVEDMATELSALQIYSEENRFDGKMHAQVCGLPTGRINVYEIGVSDLSKAKQLGFQVLDEGE